MIGATCALGADDGRAAPSRAAAPSSTTAPARLLTMSSSSRRLVTRWVLPALTPARNPRTDVSQRPSRASRALCLDTSMLLRGGSRAGRRAAITAVLQTERLWDDGPSTLARCRRHQALDRELRLQSARRNRATDPGDRSYRTELCKRAIGSPASSPSHKQRHLRVYLAARPIPQPSKLRNAPRRVPLLRLSPLISKATAGLPFARASSRPFAGFGRARVARSPPRSRLLTRY